MGVNSTISDLLAADLVITNGKIVTVDRDFSIAEAVAVKNGSIIAVGKTDVVNSLAGKRSKTIDLKGNTMLPGINDSHCHISDWALTRPPFMLDIRFPIVKSIADILEMLVEKAEGLKPGEWILGEGWDEGYLDECLSNRDYTPTKVLLDKVAPRNPVALTEYSEHR
jgi:predicted amidohydrolase YtcJ